MDVGWRGVAMPIRMKIVAACGGLALIAAAVGGFSLWATSMSNAAFQVAAKQSLPAIDHLLQIDRDFQEVAVAERSLMFMKQDTPDATAQVKRHSATLARIGERWKTYTEIPADDKERKLWPALETARTQWEAASREVIKTLAADTPHARRDAIDLSMGETAEKFDRARLLLGELVEYRTVKTREHAVAEEARASRTQWWVGLTVLAALAVALVVGRALARAVGPPLQQTVTLLRQIAEGEGDLTRRLEVRSRDEIGEVRRWFNTFVEKVHGIMAEVRTTAGQNAGAAQQLSAAASQLSSGAQEQAASLEETAASLEQITATMRQNTDNARQASQLAAAARDTAVRGGEVVTETMRSMQGITQASRKIADIITVIDEIAFQTNLLALNAAVEAARAGDQGRGFAVVAAEVRNLAQRSATAAKEIKELIKDSVGKVEGGSALVTRSGETLTEIVSAIKRVADIVADIATATQEQSSGIDQVNRAVAQMDGITQGNASQTEELSTTAQLLAGQAEQMLALVGRFTLEAGSSAPSVTRRAPPPPAPAIAGTGLTATRSRRGGDRSRQTLEVSAGNGDRRRDSFDEF